MTDRNDRSTERRPAEGVRIIGAEEAQAALEAGQAAGRRAEDELRFGDVPPAPQGPRPAHRFPLPDSVDPAVAVPRPPIAPLPATSPVIRAPRASEAARSAPVEEPFAADDAGLEDETAEDGTAQASLFLEADPTGRVPVFDPSALPHIQPEAEPTVAFEPDESPAPAVEPPPETSEWAPPALDRPGSGLRWATPAPESEPAIDLDESEDLDDVDEPGEEPWASTPGPDDPTGVNPAVEPSWDRGLWPPPAAELAGDEAGTEGTEEGEPPASATGEGSEERGEELARRIPAPPPPEDGITLVGSTELPHWTDPPTGEVPIALAGLSGTDDDTGTGGGVRWRSQHDAWEDGPDVEELADDDAPLGALDQTRSDESDLFSFDEAFERLEEERTGAHPLVPFDDLAEDEAGRAAGAAPRTTTTIPRPRREPPAGAPRAASRHEEEAAGRPDLISRLAVGVGLGLLAILAYAVGARALLALTAVALVGAAAEAFTMLRRSSGFRPATLIGLLATLGLVLGAWWKGVDALPLVMAVTVVATMLWYLLGVSEARPLANVMATLTTVAWVGFLGGFGALLLRAPHGRGLFFTAVVTVVVADVLAYFGGRAFGSHRLAPYVSPGKTVEGLVAGAVGALLAGAVFGHLLTGWGGFKHGLELGAVVAVFAPIGDLFESLIKRDLDVKDSGHTLGGHGGLLDRFDSLLLVLPASYYLAVALHLV